MHEIGINGPIWRVVVDCYCDIKTTVTVDGIQTPLIDVLNGIRQGGSSSPTLFDIFIDGLITKLKDLKIGIAIDSIMISCLLFADDVVLLANSLNELQELLNVACEYAFDYLLMLINVTIVLLDLID